MGTSFIVRHVSVVEKERLWSGGEVKETINEKVTDVDGNGWRSIDFIEVDTVI